MYVGIAAPPRWGAGLYNARCLVEVQQCSAEEEDRREDQEREQRCDADGLVADTVQHDDEDEPGQEDGDHERRESTELVHEVRARQSRTATQRVAETTS